MKRALLCLFISSLLSVLCPAQAPTTAIKVDQAGYLSSSPKVALVSAPGSSFVVKRVGDGATVLQGKLSVPAKDQDTGDTVQAADFTSLKTAGNYYLEIAGVGRSWPFAIGPDVYSRAFYLAMRGFYGQRCGTAVDMGPEFAAYKHSACHLNGEFHESSGKQGPRPNIGGWHDAGDYGRYVVNSGISTGSVLWAYEMFPGESWQREAQHPGERQRHA